MKLEINVSFIVPVYKVEAYLDTCVQSLLAQTMREVEILLVDDGSPDKCPAMCDAYAAAHENIRVIHKPNGGLSSARNAGLREARGEYIFFVDSDDAVTPDAAEKSYAAAKRMDADILQFSYQSWDDGMRRVLSQTFPMFPCDVPLSHADICRVVEHMGVNASMIFTWRNLYRRVFLEKHRIVFDESLLIAEDAPFDMQAFLCAERVAATKECLYRYRHRAGSLMRAAYKKDYDSRMELQWQKKREIYAQYCQAPSAAFYADLARYSLMHMTPLLLANAYRGTEEAPSKAVRRIYRSEMLRQSFREFDLKTVRSNSLDWWMLEAARLHCYPGFAMLARKLYRK